MEIYGKNQSDGYLWTIIEFYAQYGNLRKLMDHGNLCNTLDLIGFKETYGTYCNVWKFMKVNGHSRKSMEISGNYEIYSNFGKFIESMEINEKILQSMEIYGNLWKFMGFPWIFRDLWKFWKSMEICGKNAIYGNLWKFMISE